MRIAAIVLAVVLPVSAQAQCQSYGWRLISSRVIGPLEVVCVYEKSGHRVSIIAGGPCPLSPC